MQTDSLDLWIPPKRRSFSQSRGERRARRPPEPDESDLHGGRMSASARPPTQARNLSLPAYLLPLLLLLLRASQAPFTGPARKVNHARSPSFTLSFLVPKIPSCKLSYRSAINQTHNTSILEGSPMRVGATSLSEILWPPPYGVAFFSLASIIHSPIPS
ncbi:hypothetical protein F4805DRAFT_280302 [Annulohypoxylon moriforme]|nr:hypothetical protein F4805DRAFT_280302 [Annulohypoxylon moriforme]